MYLYFDLPDHDRSKEVKYIVDFDPELARIITETKYLEQLGFAVPELARNVALQVSQLFSS